nr:hypothetical protein [Sedimentibacter sp.]
MNRNDFFIYDEIGEEYNSDKKIINEELLINTSFKVVNESKNIIKQIYKHCFEEAFCFSWSYNLNIPKLNNCKINNDEVKYEEAIFEHCVISAAYTVQYLLYNDLYIKPSELGNIMEGNGLNSSIGPGKNKKIKIIEDCTKVEFLVNGVENDKNINIKSHLEELMANDNANYIEQTLGVKDKFNISLFLSNFSYVILKNSNMFKPYKSIEDVNKSNDTRKVNKNIKEYLTSYINTVNEISLIKGDDFSHTTNVDKMLFYYKKERLLHSDYIKFCVNKCGLDLYINNTDEEIIKKCMLLPNVFTRKIFAERFSRSSYDEESYYNVIDDLNHLLNVTFPIFEKAFFITLYEYCTTNSKQAEVKKRLKYMNDLLTNYIDNKIYKEKDFNVLLATVNSEDDTYSTKQAEDISVYVDIKYKKKSEDNEKVRNDKLKRANNETINNRLNIYELLKYAIENKRLFKNNNILPYKAPLINIPYFVGKFNEKEKEKEKINYLKEEIAKDYSVFISFINSTDLSVVDIEDIMQKERICRNKSIVTNIELIDANYRSPIDEIINMQKFTEEHYQKIYSDNSIKNRKSIFDDYIKGKPKNK